MLCICDGAQASKFLDVAGGTLDYHRYADCLFDIVISGGLLGRLGVSRIHSVAPGGEVSGPICPLSLFELPDAQESIQSVAQVMAMFWVFSQEAFSKANSSLQIHASFVGRGDEQGSASALIQFVVHGHVALYSP